MEWIAWVQKSWDKPSCYRDINNSSSYLIFSFRSFKFSAHSGISKFGVFLFPFFFFGKRFAGSVGFFVYGSSGFLVLKSITKGSGYGSGLTG